MMKCLTIGRHTIQKPILCRLIEEVPSHGSIPVNEGGLVREIADKEVLCGIRILHDEPEASLVTCCKHLQAQLIEVLPIPRPFYDGVRLLLDRKLFQVMMLSGEVELIVLTKVYAREKCHN